jgi:hypothetical protein
MGGNSGGGGSTQVIDTNAQRTPHPLEPVFMPHAELALNANQKFAQRGTGFRYMPTGYFGQVEMAGPNPTIFGNPYGYSQHAPFFGPQPQGASQAQINARNMPAPANPNPQQGGGNSNPPPPTQEQTQNQWTPFLQNLAQYFQQTPQGGIPQNFSQQTLASLFGFPPPQQQGPTPPPQQQGGA